MTTVDGQGTRLEEVGDAFDFGAIPGIDSRPIPPAREATSLPELRRATRDPDRVRGDVPGTVLLHRDDGADDQGAGRHPSFIPDPFVWSNFAKVFHRVPFFLYTWNTLQIALLSTAGIILSCIPVAYALGRMRWKGRQVAFLLVLSTLMLPVQVTIVPLYVLWVRLGQIDHLTPLILPSFLGDAFSIFLLRQFFMTIPEELVRRRSRGRRERVPDHDAGDRAAGQACDRRRRIVQLPLQLERPVLAAALRGEQPAPLDADARPHGVPAAARHGVEPHHGDVDHDHASRSSSCSSSPSGRSSRV